MQIFNGLVRTHVTKTEATVKYLQVLDDDALETVFRKCRIIKEKFGSNANGTTPSASNDEWIVQTSVSDLCQT